MNFKPVHMNINVMNLEKSEAFYKDNLGMHETRRKTASDGSFELVYLSDENNSFELELTYLKDRTEPYDLSDNEIHLAFVTDNYEEALSKHQANGVVSMINEKMGIYFIEDPDGYWVEIIPAKK